VAEQLRGVLFAPMPLRAGPTVKLPRQQIGTSLMVEVKLMGAGHTEWIGNDKSASWRVTRLFFERVIAGEHSPSHNQLPNLFSLKRGRLTCAPVQLPCGACS